MSLCFYPSVNSKKIIQTNNWLRKIGATYSRSHCNAHTLTTNLKNESFLIFEIEGSSINCFLIIITDGYFFLIFTSMRKRKSWLSTNLNKNIWTQTKARKKNNKSIDVTKYFLFNFISFT